MIRLAIRILMNQQVHWNVTRVLNIAQLRIVMILVVILPFFHYVRDNTVPPKIGHLKNRARMKMMMKALREMTANRVGNVPPNIFFPCNKQLSTMN